MSGQDYSSRYLFFGIASLLLMSVAMFVFCVQNAVWLSDSMFSLPDVFRHVVHGYTAASSMQLSDGNNFPQNFWFYACVACVQSLCFVIAVVIQATRSSSSSRAHTSKRNFFPIFLALGVPLLIGLGFYCCLYNRLS